MESDPTLPPPVIPPDHTDEERCKLLGTTGLVVQASMGVFVILSLVVKRQLERRKRSWRIWVYDVGKQLAGQAVVHGLNILISDVVASVAHNNPCSLYFLNVLIDTTIGVGIIYLSLKAYTWYFSKYMAMEGFISGQYGHPPNPIFWWKQLAPYIMSIITMKLLVLLPLTLPGISKSLIDWSHNLLDHLGAKSQVIFVMAIFPLVMNVLQFCLVDQVIKAGGKEDEEDDYNERGGDYQRIRGHDDDQHNVNGRGDIESGLTRQISSNSINRNSRKGSSPSIVIPSSPLLTSNQRDYGSATPSPIGSPVKNKSILPGQTTDSNSLWSKLINKVSDVSSSTRSSSTVFFDAQTDLESNPNSVQSRSTIGGTSEGGTSRLYVRDERNRRGQRSAAPSPETMPFEASPSMSSIQSDTYSEEEQRSGGSGRTPSPPLTITNLEGISRHPPRELEREARWTLSPPESPTVTHGNTTMTDSNDSVSLKEVNRS
ncbi:hypothetical protein L486_07124 [Kwoniella mangroviensis CBS 10435]|uniref:Vacuolar membrane protein n=1 Tax=Kwoniella mangroviensis CBS 10435 TaxID=1331196 RepID=A0A1B9IIZ5_9TREE|nr:uncharacterized protein I203_07627 [Kwoniella mangroviensis CBS 8507]OCF55639.1 hypothetical protein L486_07124 [Kwoniella mangroviensis CBS 10435]OCF63203.1 hypothetical protein I203_07627 [Kwoniella mangroviensis CBS 8507]OCF73628.1 hypothetical protein I204_05471 [Kwoniella mangroviensis CBS 8886]